MVTKAATTMPQHTTGNTSIEAACCCCSHKSEVSLMSEDSLASGLAATTEESSVSSNTFSFFLFSQPRRRCPTFHSMTMVMLLLALILLEATGTDAFRGSNSGSWFHSSPSHLEQLSTSSRLFVASYQNNDMDNNNNKKNDVVTTAAQQLVDAVNQKKHKQKKKGLVTKANEKQEEFAVDFDWKSISESVFSENDQRPVILFDGVCNLCNGGVNFVMDHDPSAKFRFASLQTTAAQSLLIRDGRHPTQTQTIVLVTPHKSHTGSLAVAKICSQLEHALLKTAGQVGQVTPKWIREGIFKVVSKHRYMLGENDSCRLDLDGEYSSRFVSDPSVVEDLATTTTSTATKSEE